jgi:hypothetical protein
VASWKVLGWPKRAIKWYISIGGIHCLINQLNGKREEVAIIKGTSNEGKYIIKGTFAVKDTEIIERIAITVKG